MPSIPRLSPLRTLLAVLCAAISTLGNARPSAAQTIDESGHPDSILVYAADLEAHPERYARADQILVFRVSTNVISGRFKLKAGSHRFCLYGGAGYYSGLIVRGDRGPAFPSTPSGDGCVAATLPGGIITVTLQTSGGTKPDSSAAASVRVDPPVTSTLPIATPLTTPDGSPVGGYWLMQDASTTEAGLLIEVLSALGSPFDPSQVQRLAFQLAPGALSPISLLRFPDFGNHYTSATLPPLITSWFLDDDPHSPEIIPGPSCGPDRSACDETAYASPPKLQVKDLGDYRFKIIWDQGTRGKYGLSNLGYQDPPYLRTDAVPPPGDTFQVVLRYFADGTQIGDLRPGEVAVYDQCDFKGRAAVLIPFLGVGQVSPPYDLAALDSFFWHVNGTLKSIKVSHGVGAYWGSDASDVDGATIQNNSCLSGSPQGKLYVEPLSNVLSVAFDELSQSCVDCDLSGLNLGHLFAQESEFVGWDLTGANFDGAQLTNVGFNGAILSHTSFVGASLIAPDFEGATDAGSANFSGALFQYAAFQFDHTTAGLNLAGVRFCSSSFHGADKDHPLDLTVGRFAGTVFDLSPECSLDLRNAQIDLSNTRLTLDPATGNQWGAINLTNTVFTNVAGKVLSSHQRPLDLSRPTLVGTNLNRAILDYAQGLAGKDLTGIHLNKASLQYVNLQAARLYSANLQSSNLTGANLNAAYLTHTPGLPTSAGAHLDGAYLFNVNLSQAQLSGASFAYASFYGVGDAASSGCGLSADFTQCATAVQATMDDTNFSNAYLYGVDFSSSTAQGINFTGAYLAGANFTGATISSSTTGNPTGFNGVSLEGATFLTATVPPSISFAGSFFDFEPGGNVVTLLLDGHYTTFTGYWGTPGAPVCATMTYGKASVVPPTTGATVCPDGGSYEFGCGPTGQPPWKSNADLPASYTFGFPSTYYPQANTPACTADPLWNQGPGQTLRPERAAGETR